MLAGRAREVADELGVVEVALSLSHTNQLAVANALAITQEARPKPKARQRDERSLIAQSFKEARAVLDELDELERVQVDADASSKDVVDTTGGTDETRSEH